MRKKLSILIIDEGGFGIETKKDLKMFSHVIPYYFKQQLLKDKDVKFCYYKMPRILKVSPKQQLIEFEKLDLSGINHIVGLSSRFFSMVDKKCIDYLKSKISGLVTQTYDCDREFYCDVTFCLAGSSKLSPKSVLIGWGADPEVCYPRQNNKILTILLDHSKRSDGQDWSNNLARKIYEFSQNKRLLQELNQKYNYNFQEVKIKRFKVGFTETITSKNVNDDTNNSYKGARVSYLEFCKEYGKAHIFVITHPESLGMSILEASMSGALVIAPNGFICKDRLELVRHIKLSSVDDINWDNIFKKMDIQESRKQVINYTWDKVFKKLINFLKTNGGKRDG